MKKGNPYKQYGYYPDKGEEKAVMHRGPGRPQRPTLPPRIRALLMIVCAIVFVVCAYLLIDYYSSVNRAKQATASLREVYTQTAEETGTAAPVEGTADTSATETPLPENEIDTQPTASGTPAREETILSAELTETDAPALSPVQPTATPALAYAAQWPSSYAKNPQLLITDSFQKLRQQNKDIVGWLTIDDVLDEPVLQRDNAFYLTHDSTGAENVTGALFLDENCNLRTLTPNLLIHGHNMKEGAMFGCLKKYKVKDASFYKSHPYITFNTLYEEARYVIFAVAEVNIQPSAHYYLPFWRYLNFSAESDFTQYLSMLRTLSHFQTQVDVRPGDRLLTLATCTGDDKDTRLLVAARMLRDNEDSISLNQGILSTQVK